ncbi:hypothetical protein LTR15_011906 [Elasticomyces elasticus]|nr:hypothetical protein LTR15_011906 [Elasticomyces elasticus]
MQFARQVLVAVDPGDADYPQLHQPLLRFIAVVIASLVCLLVYFSRQKSLWANNITAVGKLLLLVAVTAAGGNYIRQHGAYTRDWSTRGSPSSQGWTWTYGILTVFFGYHGWDNATLVAGEVPRFSQLRLGFIVGVSIVGFFYLTLATLVGLSFSWDHAGIPPANFMSMYFGDTNRAIVASAILTALSATGSMISVTYTCTRGNPPYVAGE